MRHFLRVCLTCLMVMLVSACSFSNEAPSPSEEPIPSPSAESASASPPATLIEDLKSFLLVEYGVSPDEATLEESESVEWADACLEVPKPNEFCAQGITPGYRIVLATPEGNYEFHTDATGQSVRLARSPSE